MSGNISFEAVTFIIALGGIAFGIYHFFRNPDIDADKRLCLLDEMLKSEREKNQLLTQTQQNHLHTIEGKVDKNNENIKLLTGEMVKMGTILDERLPKKDL